MLDFTLENIGAEDVERQRALYESVRELIDATVRTQADAAAVAAAKTEIDSATARLRRRDQPAADRNDQPPLSAGHAAGAAGRRSDNHPRRRGEDLRGRPSRR